MVMASAVAVLAVAAGVRLNPSSLILLSRDVKGQESVLLRVEGKSGQPHQIAAASAIFRAYFSPAL
jgi:hypothetical protein